MGKKADDVKQGSAGMGRQQAGKAFPVLAAALVLVALVLSLGGWANGQSQRSLASRRSSLHSQIQQKQGELREAKEREQREAARLQRVRREINATAQQRDAARHRWALAKKREEEARKGHKAAVAKYNRQKEAFQERVVELYMEGETTYLEVLLEARDFYDLVNRAYLCQKLVEADLGLFKAIKEEKERLAKAKEEWRKRGEEAKAREAELREREAVLEVVEGRQENIAARARDERRRAEQELAILQEASRQVEAMLRRIGRSSTVPRWAGGYRVPVSGRLTSGFGMRYHPILGGRRMHTGVDIAAPVGTAIAASAGGVVVFSGWMRGYGNTVIIDHGGGISTLYAHCSRLLAGQGQAVKQGQTVASVGTTGFTTGPHVHWEKRVNGTPVNPL